MKNSVKIFASILLIVLGNALIFPFGFWLVWYIAVQIPKLWLAELIAAIPTALVFVLMRRLFNRIFKLDMKRYAAVLACALPSLLVSFITFLLMLKADVAGDGLDFSGTTIVTFFAIPYSVFCVLVISTVFGAEYFIGRLLERSC